MPTQPDDEAVCSGETAGSPEPRGARILGHVARSEVLGPFTWLTVTAPGWQEASAGQFALVQWEKSRTLLPRALSVAAQGENEVSFLIAPVGQATRELCGLREGDRVWILGPLGRGFDLPALVGEGRRTVVVAGGVGVAPFSLLLTALRDKMCSSSGSLSAGRLRPSLSPGFGVLVLLGFRDSLQLAGAEPVFRVAADLREAGFPCRVEVVTEDGSQSPAAKVTDLLGRHLLPGDRLAVCGPWEMARAVQHLCLGVEDVRAWYSLEANMACGVGSCHGCAVPLADGSFARVCHEGPVFAGEDIFGG